MGSSAAQSSATTLLRDRFGGSNPRSLARTSLAEVASIYFVDNLSTLDPSVGEAITKDDLQLRFGDQSRCWVRP